MNVLLLFATVIYHICPLGIFLECYFNICYENNANICNSSWGGGVDVRTPLTCKLNYQHLLRQRSVLDAAVWVWKCRGVMQCSETPLWSWEKSLQVVSSTLNYWARRSLVTLCKTFTAELDDTLSLTSKNAHIRMVQTQRNGSFHIHCEVLNGRFRLEGIFYISLGFCTPHPHLSTVMVRHERKDLWWVWF